MTAAADRAAAAESALAKAQLRITELESYQQSLADSKEQVAQLVGAAADGAAADRPAGAESALAKAQLKITQLEHQQLQLQLQLQQQQQQQDYAPPCLSAEPSLTDALSSPAKVRQMCIVPLTRNHVVSKKRICYGKSRGHISITPDDGHLLAMLLILVLTQVALNTSSKAGHTLAGHINHGRHLQR